MENIGQFDVVVRREDGPDDITLMVDYHTEDGSAEAGSDYIRAQGTLTFHPGERHKVICYYRPNSFTAYKIYCYLNVFILRKKSVINKTVNVISSKSYVNSSQCSS